MRSCGRCTRSRCIRRARPSSPNGLPVFDLGYRNDDGGPTFGKDSRLEFTAPATGTYYFA